MKSVCLASPRFELSDLQKRLIAGMQKHITETDFDIDQLQPLVPGELNKDSIAPEFAERIIRGAIVAACIDGEITESAAHMIGSFADALDVDRAPVKTAQNLARNHVLLAKIDIIRKSLPGVKIRQTIHEAGLLAMAKQALPLLEIETPSVTKRFETLRTYPEGTLGRDFDVWDYFHRPLAEIRKELNVAERV